MNSKSGDEFVELLKNLYLEMISNEKNNDDIVNAKTIEFLKQFQIYQIERTVNSVIGYVEQQDCVELLEVILNKIIYDNFTNTNPGLNNIAQSEGNNFKNLFYVNIEDLIDCSNNHSPNILKKCDIILRLGLPYEKDRVALVDLLNDYFLNDDIEISSKCECGSKRSVQKRFIDLPSIILIQLKRYLTTENGSFKNKTLVPIDFNLEFNTFNQIKKEYELVSIVCHIDDDESIQHGHYISYCREDNQSWSIYNDANVKLANFADTETDDYRSCSENAYLLCYVNKQVTIFFYKSN